MKIIESPTIRLTQPKLRLLLGVFSLLISTSVSFIPHPPTYTKRTTVTTTNIVPTKLFHNKGHDFFDDTWGWNNNNPPSNDENSKNGKSNEGDGNGKDVFDMEELKARISSMKQTKSIAARASSGLASGVKTSTAGDSSPAKKPDEVHIILFNPDTEQEGVHTIEFPKGSGNNVILAFENAQACDMFSKLLKDQLYMNPIPQKMNLEFLEDYCTTLGVSVQLIPNGMNIRPPKDNAESLTNPEWKDNIATLESIYSLPSTPSFQDGGNTNINSSGSDTESGNNVHPKNDQKVNVMVEQEENENMMISDDLMADVKFVLSDHDSFGVWE